MTMTRVGLARMIVAVCFCLSMLAAAAEGSAVAQIVRRATQPVPVDPDADVPVGVPDSHGCIKWCRLDRLPCDPPSFKLADSRCAQDR